MSTTNPLRIGFIGLGSLGEPLCNNLVKAGFPVTATDLSKQRASRVLANGACWSDAVAGVCCEADVVITVLPSPAISREVVEGPDGVFQNLAPGGVWIEMSTTDAEDLKRLAQLAARHGIEVLECPVTGGVHLAESGRITVLVGGDEAVYRRVEGVLQVLGGEIVHLGGVGNASVVKVVTNLLAFVHLVAVGEAMMIAAKQGVDLDATYRAIRASSGNSFVHETESKLILSGSFDVKFDLDLACKDLELASGLAERLGVPLAVGAVTEEIFHRARWQFGGDAQSPEVVRLLEAACGMTLRAEGYPTELVAD